jgi:hypothetical protein
MRGARSGHDSPVRGIGLALQLVLAVAFVLVAVVTIRLAGDQLARDLRQKLLWLTPERAAVAAIVVAALLWAWSLVRDRVAPIDRPRPRGDLPVVVLLSLVVVAGSTFRLLLGRASTEPRLFPDELIYSGAAKTFALEGKPLVRGELDVGHSILYPLFLSPAYRFAVDGAQAFDAVKAMNAVAVVSAAIPAYLLARRIVPAGWALLVAALVAFAPWTAYASLVMTESLFLPAFTTFVLLLARMLERPSPGRQVTVVVALAVLVGIRPQALVLVAAVLGAIPFAEPGRPGIPTVRRCRPLLAGLGGAGAIAALVAAVARPDVPAGWGRVVGSLADPVGLVTWSLWNLAPYELALGVAGVAVFPVAVHDLLRSGSERDRSTGLALAASVLAVMLSVALISASPEGLDILHERYLFYATPLFLVGLARWLHVPTRRGRAWALGLGAAAVWIAASVPGDVLERSNNVEAPTATWFVALHASLPGIPLRLVLVGLATLGVLVLALSRTRAGPVLAVMVAFVALVCGLDYSAAFSRAQDHQLAWVDRLLPDGGRAALVHLAYSRPDQPCGPAADEEQERLVIWEEFFNTRIDGVYHVTAEIDRDALESRPLTIGPGGIVLRHGVPFSPRFALLDSRQPVVGRRLGRLDLPTMGTQFQEGASLTLWQVEPPLRFLVHAQPLPPRADERECA